MGQEEVKAFKIQFTSFSGSMDIVSIFYAQKK